MNWLPAVLGASVVGALGPWTCLGLDDEIPETTATVAQRVWTEECAGCHGMGGAGDGKDAASLPKPPPDFSDPCRPVSREWLQRVILSGGEAFGGSPEMRPHHELKQQPEVLAAIVDVIVALRKSGRCKQSPQPAPDVVD